MAIVPGWTASLTTNIAGAGARANNFRRLSNRETVSNADISSSGSSVINNVLQEQKLQISANSRLTIQAQYSAGGAGDPPAWAAGGVYGNIPVVAGIGSTVSGNFITESLENSGEVSPTGVIDYTWELISNGSVVRS